MSCEYLHLQALSPLTQRSNAHKILTFSSGNDYLLQVDRFQEYYDVLPENTASPHRMLASQIPPIANMNSAGSRTIRSPLSFPPSTIQQLRRHKPLFLLPPIRWRLRLPSRLCLPAPHDGQPFDRVSIGLPRQGQLQVILRRHWRKWSL